MQLKETREHQAQWLFFFDKMPNQGGLVASSNDDKSSEIAKPPASILPRFQFLAKLENHSRNSDWKWWGLQERSRSSADSQEVLQFLKFCCEDEEELSFEVLNLSLCSQSLLFKFIDHLKD